MVQLQLLGHVAAAVRSQQWLITGQDLRKCSERCQRCDRAQGRISCLYPIEPGNLRQKMSSSGMASAPGLRFGLRLGIRLSLRLGPFLGFRVWVSVAEHRTRSGSTRCGRLGSLAAGAVAATCTDAALMEALDRNVALSKLIDDVCRPGAAQRVGQQAAALSA